MREASGCDGCCGRWAANWMFLRKSFRFATLLDQLKLIRRKA
jgi:hypothetical protein